MNAEATSAARPHSQVVSIEGTFDLFSSVRVLEAIRNSVGPVEIDLRRVSASRDAALRTLADVLTLAGPERIRIKGLSEHQRRILRYLGVATERYEAG